MALHPLNRPVASDLSQQVLERRRRLAELPTPELDESLRRLYPLAVPSIYRRFIADVEESDLAERGLVRHG